MSPLLSLLAAITCGPQQVNDLIRMRRGVFVPQFEPDNISWQFFENANRAPSHKRTES